MREISKWIEISENNEEMIPYNPSIDVDTTLVVL